MNRVLALLTALALLAAPAGADRVLLKDGRTFEGKVTEADGNVLIEVSYGTVKFPAAQVESIERMPTADEVLQWQLGQIDRSDPDALCQAAEWARDNHLTKQADELLTDVLSIDPNHLRARNLLGYLRADGKWMEVPEAMDLAAARLEAGKCEPLLCELLPAIREVVDDPRQLARLKDIEAHGRLRLGQFGLARKAFAELAATAAPSDAAKYKAIAQILTRYPEGMYVIRETYPATAMLLSANPSPLKPGPASLSRPEVLAAALRDHAKAEVARGRDLMNQARGLAKTEPEAAKARYELAGECFDAADAIVPRIARSYRVEIARRQVEAITDGIKVEAQKFDLLKEELGKRNLSPIAYRDLLTRMLRTLNNIRSDLNAVLRLAEPFERELILEITDAKGELQTINALRDVLTEQLNALR
ncbi:MAG TPA: hypothetical protein VFJ30_18570 [Phycisphaerae bacterium]|nr:hypothetical protein [Phycisphaerae bacterium]